MLWILFDFVLSLFYKLKHLSEFTSLKLSRYLCMFDVYDFVTCNISLLLFGMFTPRFTCTEYTPTSYYIRWQYKSFMSCSLHFHLLLPFIIKCLIWINLKMFYMSSLLLFYYEENFVRTEQFARFTNTLKVSYIYKDNLFHDLLVLQGSQTIVQQWKCFFCLSDYKYYSDYNMYLN